MPLTQVQSGMMDSVAQYTGFKNRIINGAMVIDQRNNGASVSNGTGATANYSVDRFTIYGSQASKFTGQQNAGAITPPAGFKNYLGITSSSAYSVLASDYFNTYQRIEGFNAADLNWGTASASTVTLSAWVYSSLTGTFGGALRNSAGNRSYPFSYSVPVANTWTQISITIPGDTTGTWLTDNGNGIGVHFGLGVGATFSGTAGAWAGANYLSATGATSVVGTNGATFYITGVQLEKGVTATSFDYRPYGTELQLCQRYFEKSCDQAFVPGVAVSLWGSGNIGPCTALAGSTAGNVAGGGMCMPFKAEKRATPTIVPYDYDSTANAVRVIISTDAKKIGVTGIGGLQTTGVFQFITFSTASAVAITSTSVINFAWTASAEL